MAADMFDQTIGHVVLFILQLIAAEHLFEAYQGRVISLTQYGIVGVHIANSINHCKEYCLQAGVRCRGANLIPIRRGVYSCELVSEITCKYDNQKGSLSILRTGK